MEREGISRRDALGLIAVAAIAPQPAWAAESALTFVAVGDWGRDGAFHQAEVAARMGETAAQIGARFVLSVGDNFYEDGVDSVHDPQWRTSFEDVYRAPSLQVPWHVALGNHDYHGDAQAQVDYTSVSRRWKMPARWRSFVEASAAGVSLEVFILDTSPFISEYYSDGGETVKVQGQDTAAQLAWFEAALATSKADWKIVVGHHPIYSGGDKHGGPGGSPDLIAKIDPLIRRHGVALYLYGHEHDLQHIGRDQVHYVCTGAGSQTRPACYMAGSDFCSVRSGFTHFALTGERLRVAYRDFAGAELHVVDIDRRA
jgi:acid phosphatase